MRILGRDIPDRMKWLIVNDCWKVDDPAALAKQTGISSRDFGLELMCPDGIRSQTWAMRKLACSSAAKYYGFNPPWRFWRRNADLEVLDTFSCLVLVVTMGENVVVLDYRTAEPCVRASTETNNGWLRHKLVAESFDEFADRLALAKPQHAI